MKETFITRTITVHELSLLVINTETAETSNELYYTVNSIETEKDAITLYNLEHDCLNKVAVKVLTWSKQEQKCRMNLRNFWINSDTLSLEKTETLK